MLRLRSAHQLLPPCRLCRKTYPPLYHRKNLHSHRLQSHSHHPKAHPGSHYFPPPAGPPEIPLRAAGSLQFHHQNHCFPVLSQGCCYPVQAPHSESLKYHPAVRRGTYTSLLRYFLRSHLSDPYTHSRNIRIFHWNNRIPEVWFSALCHFHPSEHCLLWNYLPPQTAGNSCRVHHLPLKNKSS